MKFKEFKKWCNDRWFDGCWGMNTAIVCVNTLEYLKTKHFWEREKIWQKDCAEHIVPIVKATNKKIEEYDRQLEKIYGNKGETI